MKIAPGSGNWPIKIIAVHRWVYDYIKDGREFIFQPELIEKNEIVKTIYTWQGIN